MLSINTIYRLKGGDIINIRLTERDFQVMKIITKFRFCLSRQIKILAGFPSQRTCDRRLKKLIEAGYIQRKYVLFGIPGLYFITRHAQTVFELPFITTQIRVEQINHDITVIDTAIYFTSKGIELKNIVSERELKNLDGFGNPKHRPDLIFTLDNKKYCVEVELSVKSQTAFEKNIKNNYMNFDKQIWIVSEDSKQIVQNLEKMKLMYSNIQIILLEEIRKEVLEANEQKNKRS